MNMNYDAMSKTYLKKRFGSIEKCMINKCHWVSCKGIQNKRLQELTFSGNVFIFYIAIICTIHNR